ncbi:MAG: hypothetical protein KGL39_51205 [Patescibacteria group bacterium]|nr:hypothetical protein [Patescibacteria group bacterium]
MIAVGDIVEVLKIAQFGPDQWIGARVVGLSRGQIEVKALRGAFDAEGHEYLALPSDGKGKSWR